MGRPIAIWTDARIADLVKWWGEGYSCSQIAGMLKGTTRNAVIGKIFRLGLTRRVKAVNVPRERKSKAAAAPTQKRFFKKAPVFETDETNILRCAEIVPLHRTMLDLASHECRYPFGEGPFTFCGHPCEGSYCEAHDRLTKSAPRAALSQAEKLQHRREYMAAYRASKRLEAAA